eukprot:TRINITY_DN1575_c0_g1_i4.p1 TRINITY_DN1575_c0_g1~~TRINITY_DN1575_c0_g1_i4.p1  ORF type:complete len:230 (+),score=52.15 TRINITY_DN1575_c0_g1_i4:146-835(+)
MIRRPPRSTLSSSSAASDVYKRQTMSCARCGPSRVMTTICPTCGDHLSFGDPQPMSAHPVQDQCPMQMPMQMPSEEPMMMQMPSHPSSSKFYDFSFNKNEDFSEHGKLSQEALHREMTGHHIPPAIMDGGVERCVRGLAEDLFESGEESATAEIFSASIFVTLRSNNSGDDTFSDGSAGSGEYVLGPGNCPRHQNVPNGSVKCAACMDYGLSDAEIRERDVLIPKRYRG